MISLSVAPEIAHLEHKEPSFAILFIVFVLFTWQAIADQIYAVDKMTTNESLCIL